MLIVITALNLKSNDHVKAKLVRMLCVLKPTPSLRFTSFHLFVAACVCDSISFHKHKNSTPQQNFGEVLVSNEILVIFWCI